MKEGIEAKRARGEPTVPSLLADELKCNPFLRPGGSGLGRHGERPPTRLRLSLARVVLPELPLSQLRGLCQEQRLRDVAAPSACTCLPAGSTAIREALGVPAGASDAEAFGAIRSAKDSFR